MSDAIALIRFPDGDLRAAYYFGGASVVVPFLVPVDEGGALLERGLESLLADVEDHGPAAEEPADVEDVQVWTSYGGGQWWIGRASRSAALLVDGEDPEGMAQEMGQPGAPPAREVRRETPDWVPAAWR